MDSTFQRKTWQPRNSQLQCQRPSLLQGPKYRVRGGKTYLSQASHTKQAGRGLQSSKHMKKTGRSVRIGLLRLHTHIDRRSSGRFPRGKLKVHGWCWQSVFACRFQLLVPSWILIGLGISDKISWLLAKLWLQQWHLQKNSDYCLSVVLICSLVISLSIV